MMIDENGKEIRMFETKLLLRTIVWNFQLFPRIFYRVTTYIFPLNADLYLWLFHIRLKQFRILRFQSVFCRINRGAKV